MTDCLFCRIVAGEIPATVVIDEPELIAIRDVNPQAPTHVLVLPKEHIESAAELSAEHRDLWAAILAAAQHVAQADGIDRDGYRLVANIGRAGGQTVQHLHLHVLGGRQMTWPPG
ncbi:MAG: histidine triad nucleotide-binding protein [Candidatus Dormibacteraeota bacterium]|nr:histidine triad nucleotide-binding protein [Candidatus Dormibacteraeota bacterium]MBV8445231.1 histidine triad nucleotide-binding protein [Candidatus Dormibacteraeota bacterium]